MTRRVLAYRHNGAYYVSEEFNGDKDEMRHFMGHTNITLNWTDVVAAFHYSEDSLQNFLFLVSLAAVGYGYDHVHVDMVDEPPTTQEVWLFRDGELTLYSRYGEAVQA